MDCKDHFVRSWHVLVTFFWPLVFNTLLLVVFSIITLFIMTPALSAGYMQSLLLALRDNRKPRAGDLFKHLNLFFPLLGYWIMFLSLVGLGFFMGIALGMAVVVTAIFFLIYMLPLMTDQQMGITEAIKESRRMALEKPVTENIVGTAIYIILAHVTGRADTEPTPSLSALGCAGKGGIANAVDYGGLMRDTEYRWGIAGFMKEPGNIRAM